MKELDAGGKRWLLNAARKNYWRVSHMMDFDDLVQEGLWQWCRVATIYSHIDHMPHLMALFKTTFTNHLNLITKRGSRVRLESFEDLNLGSDAENVVGQMEPLYFSGGECPEFRERLATVPTTLGDLVSKLLTGATASPLVGPARKRSDGSRETLNERLCRVVDA